MPLMPSLFSFTAVVFAFLLMGASTAGGAPVRTAHVEAELVSAKAAPTPGEPLTVALRLSMERGWHTYWQNPGDSGLPTTIAWKLPAGVTAGPLQWPSPQTIPVGPLVNYGYEDEVLLLTDLALAPGFSSGKTVTLLARADWLVCKETCIPEGADLSLTLPVDAAAQSSTRWADAIAKTRAALPRPLAGWKLTATGAGSQVDVTLTPSAEGSDPGNVHFFPFAEGQIEASGAQRLTRDGATYTLSLPVASRRVGEFARVAGVLTASKGLGDQRAVTIDVPLSGALVAGTAPPETASASAPALLAPATAESAVSLGVALGFALIGGVLLNLMPCVFPVLSLKVLGFAAHHDNRAAMRVHGVAFAAGVIVSFWLLAAGLLALRAAGQQLGWGFQLQSPLVVAGLAVLFFVLALNLSGVFEMRQLLPSAVATWTAKNAYVNDALSGALAVVVASPCSAPFMGVALGYALTETATATFMMFSALGIGMAFPYLLFAFFPGWPRKLPRPGPWMLRLKQVLAFPLYATVIWLAWVLGAQLDNDAVARLGGMLLLIALALWAGQTMRSGGVRAWGMASLASIAGALVIGWPVIAASAGDSAATASKTIAADSGPWRAYAPDRVAQLTAAGRAVFVDFTAAWCVTCQVNKRLVLNTDTVQRAFTHGNVALLRADWTRRDPVIAQALAALGRNGVPVYALYRPGKEPLLLPEVLKGQDILEAIAALQ